MISLQALVLTAALTSPGQAILLDFYSDYCGPCREMQPTIQRLIAEGYDIRKVNVDQRKDLAQQYGIDQIPTFVMLSGGREVARQVGARPYDHLRQMFVATGPAQPPAIAQTTPEPVSSRTDDSNQGSDPQQQALHATVRLRVEDDSGNSFGTGTIIDARHNEALVITCGHLFRSSSGQGRIEVDLFAPDSKGPATGKLLAYDLENDVALVTIWPGVPVTPVPVARNSHQVRVGDGVFSIGCDRGANASIRVSRVTDLNKYLGPANIEVAGQPVIGRSGGGLFTADGRLIGICNLADPQDDEGIYAALSVVHDHLAANLPAGILQQDTQIAAASSPLRTPDTRQESMPLPLPSMSRQMPGVPNGGPQEAVAPLTGSLGSSLQNPGDDTEIICIIRSKNDPGAAQQTFVFNRAPQDLINYLASEHRRMQSRQPTEIRAGDTSTAIATAPDRYRNSSNGEVLRGQNQR